MIKNTEQLKNFVVLCLEEKKAKDIVVLDLEKKTLLAKYMIFASGSSTKNIASIAEYIGLELKHKANLKTSIEGLGQSNWVLIDIGDVIVHIFQPETRDHFRIEDMWNKPT